MPVSEDAGFAKYCQSHVTVAGARVPCVKDLKQTGKTGRALIRRIKAGAQATVGGNIGKSSKGLYVSSEQSRRDHEFSGEARGLKGLHTLSFQLKESAIFGE
jgi:hypothetical protein